MSKNRCSKLTIMLLALIMAFGMISLSAMAEETTKPQVESESVVFGDSMVEYVNLNEEGSGFSISASILDETKKVVDDFSKADPNQVYKLNLTIGDGTYELPADTEQVRMTYTLKNMTAQDGSNEDVSWVYDETFGDIVFEWKNGKKDSFTAEIFVTPAYPTDHDLSGTYALGTKGSNYPVLLCSTPFMDGKRGRLTGSQFHMVNGQVYALTEEDPLWVLKHVSGNYYTVYSQNNGQYLRIVPSTNGLILESVDQNDAQKFLVESVGNGYYTFSYNDKSYGNKGINNSSFNAANGFASYAKETGANAILKLYSPSELAQDAETDMSGNWIIVNAKFNNIVSAETLSSGKLVAIASINSGSSYITNGDATVFKFEHVKRDWYTVKVGNGYLNITSAGASISSNPQHLRIKWDSDQSILLTDGEFENKSVALINIDGKTESGFGSAKASVNDKSRLKLVASDYVQKDTDSILSFDINGGTGDTNPETINGMAGDQIVLPDLNAKQNGNEFIGWATVKSFLSVVPGTNHTYHDIYKAGTTYTLIAGKNTLYAVYNTSDKRIRFGIRLDGVIQDEPNGYNVSFYGGHFWTNDIVKEGRWVIDIDSTKPVNDYYVVNNVTANMKWMPSAEQIAEALMKEGGLLFDPNTMYVHWYVMKYAGNYWHVDGVIRMKEKVGISYNLNVPEAEKSTIKNAAGGYQVAKGTDVLIGAEENSTETMTPVREGYLFNGWNTEPDGTGTTYMVGNKIHLTENIYLYAQWISISDTPMAIQIVSDWPKGKMGYVGAKIKLTANLTGFEGRQYTLQWQYSTDEENWIDIPGAHDLEYVYTLNEKTTTYVWRIIAKDIY